MKKYLVGIIGTIMMSTIAYRVDAGVSFLGEEKVSFSAGSNSTAQVKSEFKCPSGLSMYAGRCVTQCDRSVYVYSTSSTANPYETKRGETKKCSDPWGTYFYYESCNEGWELQNKYCAVSACSGYIYDSLPIEAAGNVVRCKRGDNWVYKYTSCIAGWDYSGGKCDNHSCPVATYPFSEAPSSEMGTVKSCKAGAITLYGYTACNNGWDKSDGKCNVHVCDTSVYPYTYSPGTTAGTLATCKTGKDTLYGYSACNNGWYKSGAYCIENECAGYNSTSSTITGCQTSASCKKGTATVYQCTTCRTGYAKSGDNLCVITCAFTATSLPANCSAASNCVRGDASGNKTYYTTTCATCNTGWENNRGTCVENPCIGFNNSSASITGCKTTASCRKSGSTVYQCTECFAGYVKNINNTCDKTCSLTATSKPANCATAAASCQVTTASGTTTYYSTSCMTCNTNYYEKNGSCTACTWEGATLTSCPANGNCSRFYCGNVTKYKLNTCASGYRVSGNSCVR